MTQNQPTVTFLDGAMGTMLQRAGLKMGEKPEVFGMLHPDVVREIHLRYIQAGSDVIYSNTFGVNSHKYKAPAMTSRRSSLPTSIPRKARPKAYPGSGKSVSRWMWGPSAS